MKRHIQVSKIATLVLIALCTVSTTYAQEETRKVESFNEISFSLSSDLFITQGQKEAVVLKGDKDDIGKIITRVEGEDLLIYTKKGINNLGPVKIYVTVKNLNQLNVSGSGEVLIQSDFRSEEFEVNLSGSGDIIAESFSGEEIELNLSGSGEIEMAGIAEEIEINIAGSGDVDVSELKVSEVEVSIAGSGDAKVWAENELEVSIVGSGSVYYKGNPLVESDAMGSGTTKPL